MGSVYTSYQTLYGLLIMFYMFVSVNTNIFLWEKRQLQKLENSFWWPFCPTSKEPKNITFFFVMQKVLVKYNYGVEIIMFFKCSWHCLKACNCMGCERKLNQPRLPVREKGEKTKDFYVQTRVQKSRCSSLESRNPIPNVQTRNESIIYMVYIIYRERVISSSMIHFKKTFFLQIYLSTIGSQLEPINDMYGMG